LDIYVRDDDVLRLVSIGSGGSPSFGGASANGDYAAFETSDALTGDDTDAQRDVYGRDLSSETFERISVGDTGASGNLPVDSSYSGMSRDGSHVFFTTYDQILSGDTDGSLDVYERLPGSATTNRVSVGTGGTGNGAFDATFEWQSVDGTHAFFTTDESLAPTDTDSSRDIYDRSGGTTTHVSQGVVNGNGAFISSFGRSSEAGTLVFFNTREPLVAQDFDTALDIYKRDLSTSTTTRISAGNGAFDATLGGDAKCGGFPSPFPPCTDPAPGSAARALQFDVSADGQHVFWETQENIAGPANDMNGSSDVYERFGTTLRLVSATEGGGAGGFSYFAAAAADGSRAYFGTPNNLTSDDLDGGGIDGYQRVGGVTVLATIGALNDGVPDNGPFSVNTTHFTLSRDATRGYFQTFERLTADDTDSSEDVYFTETSDAITQTVPPGGTASTGSTPSATDPLETAVTPPGGGSVTIEEQAPSQSAPTGYSLLGYQATITATPNTPPTDTNPIVLRFRIDPSLLPAGYDESAPGCGQSPSQCLAIFKNGVAVGTCAPSGSATPNPCIDSRTGGAGSYVEITVLTLSASDWNFGIPNGRLVVVKEAIPQSPKDFDFTTDGGLSPPSFSLDDDSDGTLSDTRTFDDLAPGGHYSVTEAVPPGWSQDSATCDDESPVSDITISPGEIVTCTFTNTQLGYPRPQGATPMRVSLVPAYGECTDPDHTHGGPLSHPSCGPPLPVEGQLTVGTPDANGRGAKSVGFVRMAVLPGDTETGTDEADVTLTASVSDVRRRSDLDDYPGELRASMTVRDTDGGSLDPMTVEDFAFGFDVPCTTTLDTTVGSTCAVTTSVDAVLGDPAAILESKRAIWQLTEIDVFDGGIDGVGSTTNDNTLFMKQGIFVP
jgi:hypothetical protein